jgi:siroheme synthase (precorrin-2 oxidase/ferrochelatase)
MKRSLLADPIVLTQMAGAAAVVVGGGKVGERKIRGLLRSIFLCRLFWHRK